MDGPSLEGFVMGVVITFSSRHTAGAGGPRRRSSEPVRDATAVWLRWLLLLALVAAWGVVIAGLYFSV